MSFTESYTDGRHTPLQLKANAQRRAFHDRIQARVQALAQAQLALPGPVAVVARIERTVPQYGFSANVLNIPQLTPAFAKIIDESGFEWAEIASPCTNRKLTEVRHKMMCEARQLTKLSLGQIARLFGRSDHCCVLNALAKNGLVKSDRMVNNRRESRKRWRALKLAREAAKALELQRDA